MKYKLVSFACDQTDLRDFFQKSKQAQPVHNLAGWLWLHGHLSLMVVESSMQIIEFVLTLQ